MYNAPMNKPSLLLEALIAEDIALNGEGLDPVGLRQALLVTEEDYGPALDGEELLLQLKQERQARREKQKTSS